MTPYRSTIAISSLAHFTVKCKSLVVPEGDLGTDVEGTKPIFFDTGNDDLKTAGRQCHNPLWYYHPKLNSKGGAEEKGKGAGGPWDCYHAYHFYGWEAERVVAVTSGRNIMELITRSRTILYIILVTYSEDDYSYAKTKEYFQQAAGQGLLVPLLFP